MDPLQAWFPQVTPSTGKQGADQLQQRGGWGVRSLEDLCYAVAGQAAERRERTEKHRLGPWPAPHGGHSGLRLARKNPVAP